jgi:hypothetical protein
VHRALSKVCTSAFETRSGSYASTRLDKEEKKEHTRSMQTSRIRPPRRGLICGENANKSQPTVPGKEAMRPRGGVSTSRIFFISGVYITAPASGTRLGFFVSYMSSFLGGHQIDVILFSWFLPTPQSSSVPVGDEL